MEIRWWAEAFPILRKAQGLMGSLVTLSASLGMKGESGDGLICAHTGLSKLERDLMIVWSSHFRGGELDTQKDNSFTLWNSCDSPTMGWRPHARPASPTPVKPCYLGLPDGQRAKNMLCNAGSNLGLILACGEDTLEKGMVKTFGHIALSNLVEWLGTKRNSDNHESVTTWSLPRMYVYSLDPVFF